jgi:hypothetical protein
MMRTARITIALLASASVAPTPSVATPPSQEPMVHRDYSPQWSPEQLNVTIRSECQIPQGFFRTERDYDGKVRINQSPSVTKDQGVCARRIIARQNLEIRGETLPGGWYKSK